MPLLKKQVSIKKYIKEGDSKKYEKILFTVLALIMTASNASNAFF